MAKFEFNLFRPVSVEEFYGNLLFKQYIGKKTDITLVDINKLDGCVSILAQKSFTTENNYI